MAMSDAEGILKNSDVIIDSLIAELEKHLKLVARALSLSI
jgi:hypothetical protein